MMDIILGTVALLGVTLALPFSVLMVVAIGGTVEFCVQKIKEITGERRC